MKEVTFTHYFANDGTPFKTNKDACEAYDKVVAQLKEQFAGNKAQFKFWNNDMKPYVPPVYDHSYDLTKLDFCAWLKQELSGISYFSIVRDTDNDVLNHICKYLRIDSCNERILRNDLLNGDIIKYAIGSCTWINMSKLQRDVTSELILLNVKYN